MGKRTRMSFARIEESLPVPDLIEVQKVLPAIPGGGPPGSASRCVPITDYSESLSLEFVDYTLDLNAPKYPVEKCRSGRHLRSPLKVTVRLTNKKPVRSRRRDLHGDFPVMTEHGTFIIQRRRAGYRQPAGAFPGVYYARTIDKAGNHLYACTMILNRGAWIEFKPIPMGCCTPA